MANTWYEGVETFGNTSINPFFYGNFMGATKPGEPVSRTKKQAFQADAVGVAHQLTPAHFEKIHTFRLEWQPGPGGRIDWFSMGHRINATFSMEGDGLGTDWVHAYSIKDEVLNKTMGSQIPIEPTYLIFNTAVSSTWGFPYVVPDDCVKCYDCDDPKCACSLGNGFCKMMRNSDVAMYIDSVRVYQSKDPTAHVGANHTLGCDPPGYPTRSWIKGHEYWYMRNVPFSYDDKEPLRKVQSGGGSCETDQDCGSHLSTENLTALFETGSVSSRRTMETTGTQIGHGQCIESKEFKGMFAAMGQHSKVCSCNPGYTGPRCLAQNHIDDTESVYASTMNKDLFASVPEFRASPFMLVMLVVLFLQSIAVTCYVTAKRQRALAQSRVTSKSKGAGAGFTSYDGHHASTSRNGDVRV